MFFDSKVANTLSAIRVGFLAKHSIVRIPSCNHIESILYRLWCVGCIEIYDVDFVESGRVAIIKLAYINGVPAYRTITLVSTPTKRHVLKWRDVAALRSLGVIAIISTSKGLRTLEEAYTQHVGGLLLFTLKR